MFQIIKLVKNEAGTISGSVKTQERWGEEWEMASQTKQINISQILDLEETLTNSFLEEKNDIQK